MIHPDQQRMLEEQKRRQMKIAQSKASASPIVPQQSAPAPGQMGQSQSPLQQIGMQVGKKLLGSALGPLGGVLGGLFNEGGEVPMQGYNKGGSIAQQIGWPNAQDNRKKKQQRAPWWNPQAWFSNPNRAAAERQRQQMLRSGQPSLGAQIGFPGFKRNMGGPISQNPYGYNEGGSVGETPIKKVMDEQKLDQQAMAFELEQKRKQETHDMAMRQKQQQFAEAQKMKKQAAMTNKTAAKPKAPLSK